VSPRLEFAIAVGDVLMRAVAFERSPQLPRLAPLKVIHASKKPARDGALRVDTKKSLVTDSV
jgi:hypothetical protein